MYDLIVIGDDLSSHVAAAFCAINGLKTALFSEKGTAGSSVAGDLTFDGTITPVSGFAENQIAYLSLKNLGIYPEVRLLNPAYQIILPSQRIDFFHDKEELLKELAREFPHLEGDLRLFYDVAEKNSNAAGQWISEHPGIQPKKMKDFFDYLKLIPRFAESMFNTIRLKRLMSQNPSFRKVIQAQHALLSFKTDPLNSFFSSWQSCTPLRGTFSFAQGKQDLVDSLIRKIKASDGLYLSGCDCLSIHKDKVIELNYTDDNGNTEKIESRHLIVSTKWQNIGQLFDHKKTFSFGDFLRPAKTAYFPFSIFLGVNPAGLPEKLARHSAIICNPARELYADNNLIILESSAKEERMKDPAAKILLSATVFLPDHQEIWSKDNLKTISENIMNQLDHFFPFLKENILFFDPDESMKLSLKLRGTIIPRYQIKNSFFTGFSAKGSKTRYANIYLTGASLLADAGFEAEILSGLNTANLLISQRK